MNAMSDTDFIRKSLFVLGGLIIWAIHFGIIYAFNSLACARRFAGRDVFGLDVVPAFVIGTTILALVAASLLLASAWRGAPEASRYEKPVDGFLRYSAMTIAALSLLAIGWNGLPALIVPPCG